MDLCIDLHRDVLCSGLILDNPYSQTIDIGTRGVVEGNKSLLITTDYMFYESSEPPFLCLLQSGHDAISMFDARRALPGSSVLYLLGTSF
jgi:hypothetical protein